MGIYSPSNTFLDYEVQANESYMGVNGCLQCMIDIENENHNIFEDTIYMDFEEAYYVHEGYEVLYEGVFENIFSRIKEFLKKVWEKIKGIFSTFIKKLNTVIIRDNKQFVQKYQKEVRSKNLSKMKYKYCKPTDNLSVIRDAVDAKELEEEIGKIMVSIVFEKDHKYVNSVKKLIDDGDYFDEIAKISIPDVKTDYQEMQKEIHEYCYESEESEEGLNSERLTRIIMDLIGDKTKSEVEKTARQIDKYFKKAQKDVDRLQKDILKMHDNDVYSNEFEIPNESVIITIDEGGRKGNYNRNRQNAFNNRNNNYGRNQQNKQNMWNNRTQNQNSNQQNQNSNNNQQSQQQNQNSNQQNQKFKISITGKELKTVYLPLINVFQQALSQMETYHTKLVSCFLNEHKFGITQSRKVFSKAVTYNPKKSQNESYNLYLDAVEEAAEYEILSLF